MPAGGARRSPGRCAGLGPMGAVRCAWRTSQLREDGPGGRFRILGSSWPGSTSIGGGISLKLMLRLRRLPRKLLRLRCRPRGLALSGAGRRAPWERPLSIRHPQLGANSVTTAALRLVEFFVRALDQVRGRFVVLEQGTADADRNRDLFALETEAVAAHPLAQIFGERDRACQRGFRQHNHEFLTAVAREYFIAANAILDDAGEL